MPPDAPAMFSLGALEEFHLKMLHRVDEYVAQVRDTVQRRRREEFVADNERAFGEVRRRALQVAAAAYVGDAADEADVDQAGHAFAPGADMVAAAAVLRGLAGAAVPEGQAAALRKLAEKMEEYSGVAFVHDRGLQLQRIRAAVDTAAEAAAAAVLPVEATDEGQASPLERGASLVTRAATAVRRLKELDIRNDALQASAADYSTAARDAARFSQLSQRCADALREIAADDPCGLLEERCRHVRCVDKMEGELTDMRRLAEEVLDGILEKYKGFAELVGNMCSLAKKCRAAKSQATHISDALEHFTSLVDREVETQSVHARGGAAAAEIASISKEFLADFTGVTRHYLKEYMNESVHRLGAAQSSLHDTAARFFLELQQREDSEQRVIDVTDQKLQYAALRSTTDATVVAALEGEKAQAQKRISIIKEEIDKVRALLHVHGVTEAMRKKGGSGTFLDQYDKEQREDGARRYFETLVLKLRSASDGLAEITDTPALSLKPQPSASNAMSVLYSVFLLVADSNESLANAQALESSEVAGVAAKLKRSIRTAATNFSELNLTHPNVVKEDTASYPMPDGTGVNNLTQLAAPTFAALETAVRVVSGAQSTRTVRTAPFSDLVTDVKFSDVSPRLHVLDRKLWKQKGGRDVADGSALCTPAFSAGTGIHNWSVRLLRRADHLMVGVADAAMPVSGYCNAVRHPYGYFLNVTTGTLWAAGHRCEGHPYWPDPLDQDGSVITVSLDTDKRSISYIYNGADLGVAFVGVNLTRALHPAFEVTTCGCELELVKPESR